MSDLLCKCFAKLVKITQSLGQIRSDFSSFTKRSGKGTELAVTGTQATIVISLCHPPMLLAVIADCEKYNDTNPL